MKINQVSFLFIFLVTVLKLSFGNYHTYSQTQVDSTHYYYEAITRVNDLPLTNRAFDYFEKKVTTSLIAKDTINATYYLELISLGQFKLGLLYESEQSALKALNLLDKIKSKSETIEPRKRLYNQLGLIYRRVDDYANSNRFYKQALDLNTDFFGKISIVNNIANNFGDQNQYATAVSYLKDYYGDVVKLSDTLPKATYLDNYGYYQSKTGNPEGLKNMELALKIKLQINDLKSLFSSYRHLSMYYSDREEFTQAKKYAELTDQLSDSIKIPNYNLEALKLNLLLENNPKIKEYIELNTSIEKADKLNDNKFAAIRYNFKENELRLKASELDTERQRRVKLIYLFLGIVIILLSVILYVFSRLKHKKDKIQQVFNTETRISKKIHDELANDVSDLMNYVENELQTSTENKTTLLNALEDVYLRTRNISTEISSIDFVNFSESLKHLLIQHNKENVKIIINDVNSIEWDSVHNHKKLAVYRGLQELMVNMKKHSNASLVTIVFKSVKNKNEIRYTDDGIGCNIEKVSKNGLLNAESRINEVGGTLKFETSEGKGFKAVIVF